MTSETDTKYDVKNVPGLKIRHNAITEEEEKFLINTVHEFQKTAFKQTYHMGPEVYEFGWNYDKNRIMPVTKMNPEDKLTPVPLWATKLFSDQINHGLIPKTLNKQTIDHAMINVYKPGIGIIDHIDHPTYWGTFVMGFTLGSGATMRFRSNYTNHTYSPDSKTIDIFVPARSVYIMEQEVRTDWTHGVTTTPDDTVNDQQIKRTERIAITLRPITLEALPAELRT